MNTTTHPLTIHESKKLDAKAAADPELGTIVAKMRQALPPLRHAYEPNLTEQIDIGPKGDVLVFVRDLDPLRGEQPLGSCVIDGIEHRVSIPHAWMTPAEWIEWSEAYDAKMFAKVRRPLTETDRKRFQYAIGFTGDARWSCREVGARLGWTFLSEAKRFAQGHLRPEFQRVDSRLLWKWYVVEQEREAQATAKTGGSVYAVGDDLTVDPPTFGPRSELAALLLEVCAWKSNSLGRSLLENIGWWNRKLAFDAKAVQP